MVKFRNWFLNTIFWSGMVVNSLFIFLVFFNLHFVQPYKIYEPNMYILWIETIISFVLFGIAMVFLYKSTTEDANEKGWNDFLSEMGIKKTY